MRYLSTRILGGASTLSLCISWNTRVQRCSRGTGQHNTAGLCPSQGHLPWGAQRSAEEPFPPTTALLQGSLLAATGQGSPCSEPLHPQAAEADPTCQAPQHHAPVLQGRQAPAAQLSHPTLQQAAGIGHSNKWQKATADLSVLPAEAGCSCSTSSLPCH